MECPPCSRSTRWQKIAMKKPKKLCSGYFNYKGYFSLVLLALVDSDYKFLWVNVGVSGSSSYAQIFNHTKLRRRIENGTLGLSPPEPLGPGGQIYTSAFWGTMPLPLCLGWSSPTAEDN